MGNDYIHLSPVKQTSNKSGRLCLLYFYWLAHSNYTIYNVEINVHTRTKALVSRAFQVRYIRNSILVHENSEIPTYICIIFKSGQLLRNNK